jgi:hypothetical protein
MANILSYHSHPPTATLAKVLLKKRGFKISHTLVGEILKKNNFSLQANRKTEEGSNNPDRDAQFQFIYDKVIEFQRNNEPVISVDTKKQELVGNFKNEGREWKGKGGFDKSVTFFRRLSANH